MTATLNRFCNCNHSNRIARLINTCDLCAISSINERHFYHRQQLVSFSIGRQKFIGRRRHLHPYNSRFWRATEEQDEQCPSLSLTDTRFEPYMQMMVISKPDFNRLSYQNGWDCTLTGVVWVWNYYALIGRVVLHALLWIIWSVLRWSHTDATEINHC